jgi:hypothetical protein
MKRLFFPQQVLSMLSVAVFLACSQRFAVQQTAPENVNARAGDSGTHNQEAIQKGRPEEGGGWIIHLETWGGFIGSGRGRITVTSKGKVLANRPGIGEQDYSPCGAQLSIEDVHQIDQALLAANPILWQPSYIPPHDLGCCDRFGWRINVHFRGIGNIAQGTRLPGMTEIRWPSTSSLS